MTVTGVLVALLCLLLIRVPVGFAIGLAGILGLYLAGGPAAVAGILQTAPHAAVSNYSLMAIPMFILMAEFTVHGGIAKELFAVARTWIGRLPGGLGIATTFAGGLFAALSGSSTASAAALSGTALPEMRESGYSTKLSAALIAVVGTLAMMIPPSIALILFGVLSSTSVGSLLIAGIVPGTLVMISVIFVLLILLKIDRGAAPNGEKYSIKEKIQSLRGVGAFLVLFAIVIGVIYFGIATATEASAIGAAGALVISLVRRKLTWKAFVRSLTEMLSVTAMIMTIIIGAHIFGYFLTYTRITSGISEWAKASTLAPIAIVALFLLVLLIMGAVMDQVAILALTVPVMAPIVDDMGYSLVWFGVLVVLAAEIGMISPPFGMNVFIMSRYSGVPAESIFAGVLPFIGGLVSLLAILAIFPNAVLWLPDLMIN
ncbi:TRAP transporter large permease [Brevibacterium luteolum]|uniref:TRAP transporter large permease n=1 Tax=Brevibacterium luteolum TaxID=199591 RepID=UPI00223C4FBE|nr:TRAP transporter large permease [Brevibacterium luteolum]MCT1658286.1 TRAP transporter large permease [Brevibacterium luteolum]